MGILRLGLILWFAPIILLIILRLLPFVPMATFLAFAYVGGVLIGSDDPIIPIEIIKENIEVLLVILFVVVVMIAAFLG